MQIIGRVIAAILLAISLVITGPIQGGITHNESIELHTWEDAVFHAALKQFDAIYNSITPEKVAIIQAAHIEFDAAYNAAPVSVEAAPVYEVYFQTWDKAISTDPMHIEFISEFQDLKVAQEFMVNAFQVNGRLWGLIHENNAMEYGMVITDQDGAFIDDLVYAL